MAAYTWEKIEIDGNLLKSFRKTLITLMTKFFNFARKLNSIKNYDSQQLMRLL